MMTDELLQTLHSLASIMAEENALIERGGWPLEIAPLASAKLRLIGSLEALVARQDRDQARWPKKGRERKAELADAIDALRQVAEANARLLGRQIDLSRELVDAIAAEARRLSGNRRQTYRRSGRIVSTDGSAPVAVNTRL